MRQLCLQSYLSTPPPPHPSPRLHHCLILSSCVASALHAYLPSDITSSLFLSVVTQPPPHPGLFASCITSPPPHWSILLSLVTSWSTTPISHVTPPPPHLDPSSHHYPLPQQHTLSIATFPCRPSHPPFLCKRSKTGQWEGLGMRLPYLQVSSKWKYSFQNLCRWKYSQ